MSTVFGINCPGDITRDTAPDLPTATVSLPDPSFTNVPQGGVDIQDDSPEGNVFPIGVTTVTITATPVSGGYRVECEFTVTVNGKLLDFVWHS